jgi:hypothetical protein
MRCAERWLAAVLVAGLGAVPASAANIVIVNNDGAGEGFNDPEPRSPVPGNPGTTLGQQRRNVFEAAADRWGSHLRSDINVRVGAEFNNLTCTPTGAVLGSAGPNTAHRDFANAPVPNTWYVQSVANSRANVDLAAGTDDIDAQFNSRLDDGDPNCLAGISWWYGIGSPAPAGTVDLYTTVLHELAHGNGFLSLHDSTTGAKFLGFDDAYLRLIFDEVTDEGWSAMTNAERLASQVRTGQLVWTGAQATAKVPGFNAGINNGHLRLFAPNPFQPGSSVSHWDTALAPNELQEPVLTATAEDYVTYAQMQDVGWRRLIIFKDSFESADDDFWSPLP